MTCAWWYVLVQISQRTMISVLQSSKTQYVRDGYCSVIASVAELDRVYDQHRLMEYFP